MPQLRTEQTKQQDGQHTSLSTPPSHSQASKGLGRIQGTAVLGATLPMCIRSQVSLPCPTPTGQPRCRSITSTVLPWTSSDIVTEDSSVLLTYTLLLRCRPEKTIEYRQTIARWIQAGNTTTHTSEFMGTSGPRWVLVRRGRCSIE